MTIEELKKELGTLSEDQRQALIPDPLEGVTQENWGPLLKSHPDFARFFDSKVSRSVTTALTNFQTKQAEEDAANQNVKTSAAAEALKARETMLARKEAALKYRDAHAPNIPIDEFYTMLGLDDADDEERARALGANLADTRQAAINETLRANGRSDIGVSLNMSPKSFADILAMPESEQRDLPGGVVDAAIEARLSRKGPTLRDKILGGR